MAGAVDELLRRAGNFKKEGDELENEATGLSTQITETVTKLHSLEERRVEVVKRLVQVKARQDVGYSLHRCQHRRAANLSATETEQVRCCRAILRRRESGYGSDYYRSILRMHAYEAQQCCRRTI